MPKDEEQGSRPLGNRPKTTNNSPSPGGVIPIRPPMNSATTGSANPAPSPASSIGPLPSATGVAANPSALTAKPTNQGPRFPSTAHEKSLKDKLRQHGWPSFTTDEQIWWHTYVYAFRKVALGLEPTSPPPTDPRGEWFFEKLYEEALQAYRRGKTEKDQERQQYENAQKHRYFLAMIARRAHDAGETLPAGMRDDDPRWAAAIHKFAINPQFQAQDRER